MCGGIGYWIRRHGADYEKRWCEEIIEAPKHTFYGLFRQANNHVIIDFADGCMYVGQGRPQVSCVDCILNDRQTIEFGWQDEAETYDKLVEHLSKHKLKGHNIHIAFSLLDLTRLAQDRCSGLDWLKVEWKREKELRKYAKARGVDFAGLKLPQKPEDLEE